MFRLCAAAAINTHETDTPNGYIAPPVRLWHQICILASKVGFYFPVKGWIVVPKVGC